MNSISIRNIPKVGTPGHVSIARSETSSKEAQILLQIKRGCPICRGCKTILTTESFISMCLHHQKKAGVLNTNTSARNSSIIGGVFKSNNIHICTQCSTGKAVRAGNKKFIPPKGIILDDKYLTKTKDTIKCHQIPKKYKHRKISKYKIDKIKILYKQGVPIEDIAISFNIPVIKIRNIIK